MNFTYGNNDQRIKMDYSISGVNQYTRYYSENYDREENPSGYREWNYIYAPTGLCAFLYTNNSTPKLFYVSTDHLGSSIMLTDTNNNIVEEYSFDAWGRRRNPANWNDYTVTPPQYIIRGFTMHEHLDEVGLINMNGRIYDPVLGRFLQPDNDLPDQQNIQGYNRYAYANNNPLKYKDPTGNEFILDDIAAIIIGGISDVASNWDKVDDSQGMHWDRLFEYFGAGAVGAEVGIWASPLAGFAAAGYLNMMIDAGNGFYNDDLDRGNAGDILLDMAKSFANGGTSALSGMEVASDAYNIADKADFVEDNFKGFYDLMQDDNYKAWKNVYNGTKEVVKNFGENKYKDENSVGGAILSDYLQGYLTSFLSPKLEKLNLTYEESNLMTKGEYFATNFGNYLTNDVFVGSFSNNIIKSSFNYNNSQGFNNFGNNFIQSVFSEENMGDSGIDVLSMILQILSKK